MEKVLAAPLGTKVRRADDLRDEAQNHSLSSMWERLDALCELGENWNGHEVAAPNPNAIVRAKTWIESLYMEIQNANASWNAPHVTADEEGNTVFEWVRGKKRLAVYVSPEAAWYIKAWGPNIVEEMADGNANTPAERIALWTWWIE